MTDLPNEAEQDGFCLGSHQKGCVTFVSLSGVVELSASRVCDSHDPFSPCSAREGWGANRDEGGSSVWQP